jgi:hypothetical protein
LQGDTEKFQVSASNTEVKAKISVCSCCFALCLTDKASISKLKQAT